MNISKAFNPAKNFLANSLKTGDDFGTVKGNRDEATRVDSEVAKVHADAVSIGEKLDKIDETAGLKAPTFRDVSNKQVVMASAGAGAVLGGLGGILTAGGGNITETVMDINEQSLNGHGFSTEFFTYGGTPQNPKGWEVHTDALPLKNEKVGEYTVREASAGGAGNMLVSGGIGLATGALAGAGVGLAIVVGRKALGKDYNGTAARETEGDNKVLIGSGIAGAVIGAGAGAISSMVGSSTYETQSIAMETKVLGQIPAGPEFFVPNNGELEVPRTPESVSDLMDTRVRTLERRGYQGIDAIRGKDVTGEVPARKLLGGLDIKTEEKSTGSGASLLGSMAGGAAVGAVAGVAGGVLINVLRKTL